MKCALILVDIQNDFLPGGALAVPGGDEIIPIANSFIPQFDVVIATQDWHPPNHASFAASHSGRHPGELIHLSGLTQILWPTHCVQETNGAAFASQLNTSKITRVFRKGTDPTIDSYSGLFDNGHLHSTGLAEYLREQSVTTVYIMGLATDYCVKFTALDCVDAGFKVHLILEGCRGVELKAVDIENAVGEMKNRGVKIEDNSGRAAHGAYLRSNR